MKIKRINLFPIILLILSIGLTACATTPPTSSDAKIKVLTTTSFLADIAQNVAGDRLQIESLLPAGVDPHEYQPTPQDAIKIEAAQVLIVNGVGYEEWLEKILASAQTQPLIIVATDGLTPAATPHGDHPEGDPHLWMNPLNIVRYAENIRDGLGQFDPEGQDIYAANATTYIAQLNALDTWIKTEVGQIPAEKRLLVTNHEALGYFAEAYGFTVIGTVIPGLSSEAAPSGMQLADLVEQIKSNNAPAIFLEAAENPKLAEQIAEETKVQVITGLYIETLSEADGPAPTYIEMLKYDVSLIVGALK